ncbi:MAG: DUF1320 family protein [Magnetococcales bacterium]|nr:DUF1320 family protein [Magnetococcales bacterium]
MTIYATVDDLGEFLLPAYLAKAEEISPGITEKSLAAVCREIDEVLLVAGYAEPVAGSIPESLRRIAAVMAAYRTLGAITSLIKSGGENNNEFFALQRQFNQATKDLAAIREGRLSLPLQKLSVDREESAVGSAVIAPQPIFSDLENRF